MADTEATLRIAAERHGLPAPAFTDDIKTYTLKAIAILMAEIASQKGNTHGEQSPRGTRRPKRRGFP